jgi:hypothetical protein
MKRTNFGNSFLNTECVLWFLYHFGLKYFSFGEEFGEVNLHMSSRKVPFILVRLISDLNFLDRSSKNPVGAELFHAGRWKDMSKLIEAFRNFANGSKKSSLWVSLLQRSDDRVLPKDLHTWTTVYPNTFNTILVTHVKRQRVSFVALLHRIL